MARQPDGLYDARLYSTGKVSPAPGYRSTRLEKNKEDEGTCVKVHLGERESVRGSKLDALCH